MSICPNINNLLRSFPPVPAKFLKSPKNQQKSKYQYFFLIYQGPQDVRYHFVCKKTHLGLLMIKRVVIVVMRMVVMMVAVAMLMLGIMILGSVKVRGDGVTFDESTAMLIITIINHAQLVITT